MSITSGLMLRCVSSEIIAEGSLIHLHRRNIEKLLNNHFKVYVQYVSVTNCNSETRVKFNNILFDFVGSCPSRTGDATF
jgi:hypothetical protein